MVKLLNYVCQIQITALHPRIDLCEQLHWSKITFGYYQSFYYIKQNYKVVSVYFELISLDQLDQEYCPFSYDNGIQICQHVFAFNNQLSLTPILPNRKRWHIS